jgi:probable phosphomutase (TIGR03848 family)
MTTVLLIRHGTTDDVGQRLAGRAPGRHLNGAGTRQARELSERLAGVPLAAIYASPLERAQETATPIAAAQALSIVTRQDLIELDFGRWTGAEIRSLDADPEWIAFNTVRSQIRIPGGETMREVQDRVVAAINEITTQFESGIVAIVTHGDVIRAAIAHFLDMPLDAALKFEISPCSISTVRISRNYAAVWLLNDTAEFAPRTHP